MFEVCCDHFRRGVVTESWPLQEVCRDRFRRCVVTASGGALWPLQEVCRHQHNRDHSALPENGAVGPCAPPAFWPLSGGSSGSSLEGSPEGRRGRHGSRLGSRWLGLVPSLVGAGVLIGLVSVGVGWVWRRPASSTRGPPVPASAGPGGCDAPRVASQCAS